MAINVAAINIVYTCGDSPRFHSSLTQPDDEGEQTQMQNHVVMMARDMARRKGFWPLGSLTRVV